MSSNQHDSDKINAARILVARPLIVAFARNLREGGDEQGAQTLEGYIESEWKQVGELVINDPALRIPQERKQVSYHMYLDVINDEEIPHYTAPNEQFERGLEQTFAVFRSACESFWKEFSAKMAPRGLQLPELQIVSTTIYGWGCRWRVGIKSYLKSKSGRMYKSDA